MVIARLNDIQARHGYLPARELVTLAKELSVPVSELHAVASFYPSYRLRPPPRASVQVCTDLACHLAGAALLKERLTEAAASGRGGTAGGDVEVRPCSCLGRCDVAPAVMVNEQDVSGASVSELVSLVELAASGRDVPEVAGVRTSGLGPTLRTDPYGADGEHYGTLRALLARGELGGALGEEVLATLTEANLRGMGGAGFPTARKWSTARSRVSDARFVVCNADESEVGTFKDREILLRLPHLVVEAMVIAALVVGARRGYLYVRHEYHAQIERLREELNRARVLGVVGPNVLGTGRAVELEVFVSPGGYVQGEETALLEAIEGRRGQPRNKPVDVGFEQGVIAMGGGLWGKPTVVNNVETLAYVPLILSRGAAFWKSLGVRGSEGLKWVSVSGDVVRPGVFEVPMGTTYREVLELAGGMRPGSRVKAFAPSGPSFGLLPPEMLELKLDWGTTVKPVGRILGSGAVMVADERRCVLDLALNFTRFYRNESCGKCVPCRVGSQKLVDLLLGLCVGTAGERELEAVPRLAETLQLTSICGLGQVVPSPILSVMAFFADELAMHTAGRDGVKGCPAGVCKAATWTRGTDRGSPAGQAGVVVGLPGNGSARERA